MRWINQAWPSRCPSCRGAAVGYLGNFTDEDSIMECGDCNHSWIHYIGRDDQASEGPTTMSDEYTLSKLRVIVVDRVEPDQPEPDYHTHGKAVCVMCREWCWLGDAAYGLVTSGEAMPLCRQCGAQVVHDEPIAVFQNRRKS